MVVDSEHNKLAERSIELVSRIANIPRQLYDHQQIAYLLVDHRWRLIEASANLTEYGYDEIPGGEDAREYVDFLIGLDSRATLDLPIVMSPKGDPLHVVMLPEEDLLTIVLMDASQDYEQRQLVQQKANENALLLAEQKRLTESLAAAQNDLLEKNQQLKEANRLQTSFLSGVSHEFRTPLASMLGYIDLLVERFGDQSKQENSEQLEVIQRSARHLLSLVENLLDHGKLDSEEMILNPSAVDLAELLAEMKTMFVISGASQQIDLNFTLTPSKVPVCYLDASRLRQILYNVVGNAIKFTDEGTVSVDFDWNDDQLLIKVQDTGIGIRSEDLAKVGQPFWQEPKHGRVGVGLGLTITERIVDMMGGDLTIESELGEGTKVLVRLPAIAVDEGPIPSSSEPSASLQGRRFLLAEDDTDIADLLTLLLQEAGLEVTHVVNGRQVLAELKENSHDLILMDLHMPLMDGYEATRRVREAGLNLPILVMTASAIEMDRSRAEQAGCDGYLIKPVDLTELLRLAEDLLGIEVRHNG